MSPRSQASISQDERLGRVRLSRSSASRAGAASSGAFGQRDKLRESHPISRLRLVGFSCYQLREHFLAFV